MPVGRVIAVAMVAGAGSAAALVFGVLPSAPESTIVGAHPFVAFAVGWAMLAWLTTRLTTCLTAHPQQWAYVPAALLGIGGAGLLLLTPGEPTTTQLAPPANPATVR